MRKCLDPSQCVDRIEKTLSCSNGDKFLSIPEFRKLNSNNMLSTLLKESDILRAQGIHEEDIQNVISNLSSETSKRLMMRMHIDLYHYRTK